MKKAFGQTVRDLKREVNKKVLKVPSIEQKVLDATSNESWGPHGSSLADIAQATRNYHEYQIIMSIIWKRINDTGKNWRHVYKALTVLEYLVGNGSERVIDEIREHAYQISTLSDFQYIDSGGRDQGSNVRKKSQSLVVLVNDKERIQEVREKAAANREKYRNTSMGGMYKPGSYPSTGGYGDRYDDERHEGHYRGRDEDRNGYGQERDWASREEDRYGKYGESNSRDGDRHGRDYEGRYGRDGYRNDESRGRSPTVDDYSYVPRSRSSDRDGDRSYEDSGQNSSRGSVGKADGPQDGSVSGRDNDQKHHEHNPAAPPSYEEAIGDTGSPAQNERDEVTSTASAPKSSSPPQSTSHLETAATNSLAAPPPTVPASEEKEFGGFDEFDPRGFLTGAPLSSSGAEADTFISSTDPFNLNFLAIVPIATATATSEAVAFTNSGSGNGFLSKTTASDQPFEDPFGDGPFRAISSSENFPAQQQNVSTSSFFPSSNQSEPYQPTTQDNNFCFGETDILADILPLSGSSSNGFSPQTVHPASLTGLATQTEEPKIVFQGEINQFVSMTGFQAQQGQPSSQDSFPVQVTHLSSMRGYQEQDGPSQVANFPHYGGEYSSFTGFPSQASTDQPTGFSPSHPALLGSNSYVSFNQQPGSTASVVESMSTQNPSGPPGQYSRTNFISQSNPQIASQMQAGLSAHLISAPLSTNSLAIEPKPAKDKFETKSTIWKDTLNRGLVNLNISGSKTNPLADIGVDFDAINRKQKRMEKPSQTPVMSTGAMGRAMGSGTGIGRAGASALRGAPNPMVASGMNIGMRSVPGAGMGMGGARGTGMNMGIGQGLQMQHPTGFSQISAMPGAYNSMTGTGNYGNQPYSGGYV